MKLLSTFFVYFLLVFAAGPTLADQPNIVLIVADDLGYGELGCQGNQEIPTPHIDRMAESGVRCTQAYVTAPNCSPSRAGFLSGKFPTRFGYEFNPIGARNEDPGTGIPTQERLLPELLHDAGYTTALIGKWHLGGAADYHPQRHGFDEFFGFAHEGHYFVPAPWRKNTTMLRRKTLPAAAAGSQRYLVSDSLIYTSHMGHDEPNYDANNPIVRMGQPIEEPEYLTDAFAREACDFMERYQQAPFFLCLTFNAVHSPLQAKDETLEKFEHIEDIHRRIFAAMLSDLDSAVGRVTKKVDELGLSDRTLILFLSDNGGPTKELTSSNAPLRDGKGSMYEGGLRVPFIASWPERLPQGEVCDEVISSLDILPTAVALAGAELPKGLDGRNMLPTLANPHSATSPRELFWRQGNRAAYRAGPWKIVAPQRSLKDRAWELYRIDTDIGESQNLAQQHPAKLNELRNKWQTLNAQMHEPLF